MWQLLMPLNNFSRRALSKQQKAVCHGVIVRGASFHLALHFSLLFLAKCRPGWLSPPICSGSSRDCWPRAKPTPSRLGRTKTMSKWYVNKTSMLASGISPRGLLSFGICAFALWTFHFGSLKGPRRMQKRINHSVTQCVCMSGKGKLIFRYGSH